MSQERMAVEKQEKIKPLFPNTIWGWFVLLVATFICNQVMGLVWLNIAPGLLAVLFVLVQIYSIKTEKLKSKEIRVYLRSQKCWDIRQKAPDARRMSAALLGGMQANATRQMELFGRIEQRWGVFRYTLVIQRKRFTG